MKSSEHKAAPGASKAQAKHKNTFFTKKKGEAFVPENESAHGNDSARSSVQSKTNHKTPFLSNQHNIQPKLYVHPAADAYEKEADAMAERVLHHNQHEAKAGAADGAGDDNNNPSPLTNGISKVQRQRAFDSPTVLEKNSAHDDGSMQMKSEYGSHDVGGAEAPDAMETNLNASKGQGSPLPEDTRSAMESGFGTDFSGVNIHTGPPAAEMSDQIGARAFTHGNDIYFNKGEYKPNTAEGDRLIAHELTHTVQQGGSGVARKEKSLQAAKGKKKAKAKDVAPADIDLDDVNTEVSGSRYTVSFKEGALKDLKFIIDLGKQELDVPFISLPDLKKRNEPRFSYPILSARGRGKTDQRENWKKAVSSGVNAKVGAFLENKNATDGVFFLSLKSNKNFHIIGTKELIQEICYIPTWNRSGKPNSHQVDHIVEHQLGGEDMPTTKPTNYELLDSKANMSSGRNIRQERYNRIRTALSYFKGVEVAEKGKFPNLPTEDTIANNYVIFFQKVQDWKLPYDGDGKVYWTHDELVKNGNQLSHLVEMSSQERAKLQGKPDEALIYVSESLGTPKRLKLPPNGAPVPEDADFFVGMDLVSTDLTTNTAPDANAKIKFKLNKKFTKRLKADQEISFDLMRMPGRLNTFYIKTTKQVNKNTFTKFEGMSPVTVNDLTIDDTYGLTVTGVIEPNLPLFKGLTIDFFISAGELGFTANIPLGVITKNFPKLFNVTDANLQIGYSSKTNAITLGGNIKFSIEKIGEGEIIASKKGDGFLIAGNFIFDKSKFDGQLRVSYSNETGWALGGSAKIGPDKLKGVKEAVINFDYEKDLIKVSGNANLSVPGLKTIKISSTIGKEGDFEVIAEAELGQLPGVKGGHVKIIVRAKKGEDLKLGVAGKAIPDFPGVPNLNPEIEFLYDNGLFDVRAKVAYKKGRFDGTVELGVTNKVVDDKGVPQGEPVKDDQISVYGYGSLTVDLFKGSSGKITVRLTPDKKLLVAGSFTVQNLKPFGAGVDIFKKIVEFPAIKIPLVGIPGVSIFFEIGGGAYFKFTWDPLVLKELTITFQETDISEIETAQVNIHGAVGSKAAAEAYMEIKASLGAEVLIAEIRGSLAGQAGIGVEAEAGGELDATWNNEKGLQLKQITATVSVNPKAIFKIKGSVSVDLDLWVTTINLYYKEWTLAEGSADLSGLALKVSVPLKFDEKGDLIRPDFEQLGIDKPDFSGEQGKSALDSGINGEAQKERKLAKDKLRRDIANDIQNSTDDEDFSPTEYAKKMQKKYKDDEEMKTFIMDSVEEEVRLKEYQEFEAFKTEMRNSPLSLSQKIGRATVFKLWRARINYSDFQAFITELQTAEKEKQAASLAQDQTQNQTPATV